MGRPARGCAWIAIAVAAAAFAMSPRAPRAEPAPAVTGTGPAGCPPAARLAGDVELARRVGLELAVLGVFSQDIPARCPSVRVTLTVRATDEAVVVSLRDPSGRSATQIVTNAHVAATWIESWVHPELGAPLLAGREARAVEISASAAFPGPVGAVGDGPAIDHDAGGRADELGRAIAAPLPYRGLVLGASAEKLYASDDSEWRGVSLSACARWGPLCPGLLAHIGDSRGFTPAGAWSSVDRVDVDLLASLTAPFALGRMEVAPSIGIGVGALRTSGALCQPDATGNAAACDVAATATWTVGPRAEMGLAGTFPVSDRVSLLVTASLGFAPMARSGSLLDVDVPPTPGPDTPSPDGSIPDPDDPDDPADPGGGGGDPGTGDDGQPIDPPGQLVPGEPNQFTRIGIGLSVALP